MSANLAVVPPVTDVDLLPDSKIFREPGFHFEPKCLKIDHGVKIDRWLWVMREMSKMGESVQFWIGDAITYGEHEYGEMYSQAMEFTGLDKDTLEDHVYVAQNVKSTLRNELSFSHHKAVAPLKAPEQKKWLAEAKQEGWSYRELRRKIEESKREPKISANTPKTDYLDAGFKKFLVDLENRLLSDVKECPYDPFRRELTNFIRRVRYARNRSLDSDYAAVKEQIDKMACTVEEITEEVFISEREIKALMDLIVKREPETYEWRPIGMNTDQARGSRSHGLFRKDAPSGDDFEMPRTRYEPTVDYNDD